MSDLERIAPDEHEARGAGLARSSAPPTPSASRSPGRAGTCGRSSPRRARRRGRRRPSLSPPGRSVVHSLRKAVGVRAGASRRSSRCPPRAAARDEPRAARGSCSATARSGCSATTATRPGRRTASSSRRRARTELVALDPKGNVRWTLARPASRFPPWTGTPRTRGSPTSRAGGCASWPATGPAIEPSAGPRSSRPRGEPGPVASSPTPTGRRTVVYDADAGRVRTRAREPPTKLAWSGRAALAVVLAARGPASTRAPRSSERTTPPRRPSTATPPSRATRCSRPARPGTAATSFRSHRPDGLPRHRSSSTRSLRLRTAAGCS